jgi:hypothetical protein
MNIKDEYNKLFCFEVIEEEAKFKYWMFRHKINDELLNKNENTPPLLPHWDDLRDSDKNFWLYQALQNIVNRLLKGVPYT